MVKRLFFALCRKAAKWYVARAKPYIIGITGSVGKTSCRMIITQTLAQAFPDSKIYTSPKNFNSELGLALSIFRIESYEPTILGTLKTLLTIAGKMLIFKKPYDILVLEYGIDYVGEMDLELNVVHPHMAVFTMTDKVHAQQMWTADTILSEEVLLLKAAKEWVCFPHELNERITVHIGEAGVDRFIYSFKAEEWTHAVYSNYMLTKNEEGFPQAEAELQIWKEEYKITTNILGHENMWYIAVALLLARVYAWRRDKKSIFCWQRSIYIPLFLQPGRYSIFAGKHDSILIDSSYNAAPQSMRVMITNAGELRDTLYPDYDLYLCLGEMRELWGYTQEEHRALMHTLEKADRLYLIGKSMHEFAQDELTKMWYPKEKYTLFHSSTELGVQLEKDIAVSGKKALILFKGSQNTIFLEDAVKVLLADTSQSSKLCRQGARWDHKKQISWCMLAILLMLGTLSGCMKQNLVWTDMISQTGMQQQTTGNELLKWCFGSSCFTLEVADSPAEQMKGLMYRTELSDDKGMIFVYPQEWNYRFRMKNTRIPLDMIWLSKDKQIVHIEHSVQPCTADPCPTYWPEKISAQYIVELSDGMSIHHDITTGMTLVLDTVHEDN